MMESPSTPPLIWRCADTEVPLEPFLVVGVLNLTPDSFSDGGSNEGLDRALARAEQMVAAGAGMIDVGGESTRPGAPLVLPKEEMSRILPFIREAVKRFSVPISVDTRKAGVAQAAIDLGAVVVNDVSGLAFDPAMAGVAARSKAGVVLMHMRGTPLNMRDLTEYSDLIRDIQLELLSHVSRALNAGVEPSRIILDPGIGFAKTADQSLEILAEIDHFLEDGFPVMVGPSRKSFLGEILDRTPDERVAGTVSSCILAYLGGARIFRVHDVKEVVDGLTVAHAIHRRKRPTSEYLA